MKIRKYSFHAIAVLAVAGLLLITLSSHPRGEDSSAATTIKVTGAPRLLRGQKELTLARNMTISPGDEIVTGSRDSLVIRFVTNDVLNIGPLSRVRIAIPPPGGSRIRIDHKQGFVWAKVEKLSSAENRFEVATPTAVAGVRGTAFSSVVESPEKSWFCVCDGQVQVNAGGEAVIAHQGQAVNTTNTGGPEAPHADQSILEKATDATRPCFSCHQGGYSRDRIY